MLRVYVSWAPPVADFITSPLEPTPIYGNDLLDSTWLALHVAFEYVVAGFSPRLEIGHFSRGAAIQF